MVQVLKTGEVVTEYIGKQYRHKRSCLLDSQSLPYNLCHQHTVSFLSEPRQF